MNKFESPEIVNGGAKQHPTNIFQRRRTNVVLLQKKGGIYNEL